MIDERQVIDTLGDDQYYANGLNPDRVIAGARRRRTRHRIGTGLASVAVAGVVLTGFAVAGGLRGGPSVQPQVAGSGPATTESTAGRTPGKPGPSSVPSGKRTFRVVPGKHVDWRPGPGAGAKPIGTIPRSGKVEVGRGYWFQTKGTQWCLTTGNGAGGTIEPFGCRGTVGNDNLVPGLSNMQLHPPFASSVFAGNLRRVLYTVGDRYYEAKLYRLAAVPGWMVAVAELPGHSEADAVFGYDAAGNLVGRFPDAKDGGPLNDPLQSR